MENRKPQLVHKSNVVREISKGNFIYAVDFEDEFICCCNCGSAQDLCRFIEDKEFSFFKYIEEEYDEECQL